GGGWGKEGAMGRYQGSLRIRGSSDSPLDVEVDLVEETLTIKAASDVLGEWSLGQIGISGRDDGFHMRIDGAEVVIDLTDDVGFALEVGLHSASPRLRRRMGAAFSEGSSPNS
ncbi:MAG: hypothetical protein OEM66_06205, partial [Acidimicrobiia bacterium]|nr:hypothetical protein [Acidimicrobiia bacterium]